MILTFTEAFTNIYEKLLLTVSYPPCTQHKKAHGSKQQKSSMHIEFSKLCAAAMSIL